MWWWVWRRKLRVWTHWLGSYSPVCDTPGDEGVSPKPNILQLFAWRGKQRWDPLAGVFTRRCVAHRGGRRYLSLAEYSPAICVERQTELRPAGRAPPHVCHDALGQHHTEQERSCSHCNIRTIRRATTFYWHMPKNSIACGSGSRCLFDPWIRDPE